MSPDRKVGGESYPSIYSHTYELYMNGRVVIYNPRERKLIRMWGDKIVPEKDAADALSPRRRMLSRNKGWSVSEVSQTEMSLTYMEGERDLLFEHVWTFEGTPEGGRITLYGPGKGALLIEEGESYAYIPVRRKRDRDGGVLIVPVNMLLNSPVRITVNKFVG